MNFRFSSIPVDYPFRGPLDFQQSSMRALFNYGADCAAKAGCGPASNKRRLAFEGLFR